MEQIGFKNDSVGLGFRPEYVRNLRGGHRSIKWLELLTENFLDANPQTLKSLNMLREFYPMTFHGVSLSIGGNHSLDWDYLHKIKNLVRHLKPAVLSDHLSFSRHDSINSHDLLPLPYTQESLHYIGERIERIQDFFNQRFYLENPSAYVAYERSEIPEQHFFASLCKKTGCGMILDINNLYVNQCNLGIDPTEYIAALERDLIGYCHMAGHSVGPQIRIDTHGSDICEPVWRLFEQVISRFGPIPSMIERDQNLPPFSHLMRESLQMEAVLKKAISRQHQDPSILCTYDSVPPNSSQRPPRLAAECRWQFDTASLFLSCTSGDPAAINGVSLQLSKHLPTPANIGFQVYLEGFLKRLNDSLKAQVPVFTLAVGEESMFNLVKDYVAYAPPSSYSVDYSLRDFAKFVRSLVANSQLSQYVDSRLSPVAFAELATLEQALYLAKFSNLDDSVLSVEEFLGEFSHLKLEQILQITFKPNPSFTLWSFEFDICSTLKAFHKTGALSPPKSVPSFVAVTCQQGKPRSSQVLGWEFKFLTALQKQMPLGKALEACGMDDEILLQKALKTLGYWIQVGLFSSFVLPGSLPIGSTKSLSAPASEVRT